MQAKITLKKKFVRNPCFVVLDVLFGEPEAACRSFIEVKNKHFAIFNPKRLNFFYKTNFLFIFGHLKSGSESVSGFNEYVSAALSKV